MAVGLFHFLLDVYTRIARERVPSERHPLQSLFEKTPNSLQNAFIDVILDLAAYLKLSLGHKQRVVSPFNDVELVDRSHLLSNALQERQRAEPVARSLHEQDWRGQCTEHLRSQLRRITSAAQWVAETYYRSDLFFQCQMTSDPCPKAFSDKNGWPVVSLPSLLQRMTMGRNELRQRIGTFARVFGIRVVESGNGSDCCQPPDPALHPRMRRRRAGAMGKDEERRFHVELFSMPSAFDRQQSKNRARGHKRRLQPLPA
jgi:hypothetical protein